VAAIIHSPVHGKTLQKGHTDIQVQRIFKDKNPIPSIISLKNLLPFCYPVSYSGAQFHSDGEDARKKIQEVTKD
jgi:hypothetical protein